MVSTFTNNSRPPLHPSRPNSSRHFETEPRLVPRLVLECPLDRPQHLRPLNTTVVGSPTLNKREITRIGLPSLSRLANSPIRSQPPTTLPYIPTVSSTPKQTQSLTSFPTWNFGADRLFLHPYPLPTTYTSFPLPP